MYLFVLSCCVFFFFFFSSRRRHTRCSRDWSSDVSSDLDLIRGGVASYFDLRPRYTIADVMDQTSNLDVQLLDNALARHAKSGLAILARPDLPEDTQRVTKGGFDRLLGMVGRMFDHLVIDSMMSIDPVYAAAIRAADVNVVVMQLNVPSAKN